MKLINLKPADNLIPLAISLIEKANSDHLNESKTEILATSARHNMHLINCVELGIDVANCSLNVITGWLKYLLTDQELAKFSENYTEVNK